jgi:S-adenosylmethionine hydrolase
MKGVIYSLNPSAQLVDLTHQVTPQAVREGAFLLHTAYPYFPAGTVHLAVVDPGVGTSRKAICIRVTGVGYFVGPDNGLFSYILDQFPGAAVREITNPNFQRAEVSATFHGRDIFAPAAARLSVGLPWEEAGPLLAEGAAVRLANLKPEWIETPEGRSITGEIIHVDHFGTLVTNLPHKAFETVPARTLQNARLHSAGIYKLQGVRRTYGEGVEGEIIALFGSSGYLEIARVNGQAANLRGPNEPHHVWLGQKVTLKLGQ